MNIILHETKSSITRHSRGEFDIIISQHVLGINIYLYQQSTVVNRVPTLGF